MRVHETFMDSQMGGTLLRTTLGGDPMKGVKMLTDEGDSVESSVGLGGPCSDSEVAMRRVSGKATSSGDEPVLELEEEKKVGLVIAVVRIGLCLRLLEGLTAEALSNVAGARAADAE